MDACYCTITKNAAGAPILSMKQMNALRIYKHGSRPASLINKMQQIGNSLVVQWLRLCAPDTGGLGSIPA